jgi:ATP-dependent DNA helicase RecG
MVETQNIEYKQTWHDDYLKWICGFANARGGRIYIGKDDKGRVTGLDDPKSLMETLPNKIRDMLGIVCEINLETLNQSHYIEILVPPYSVPVSVRGRYYFRSGSSKMELTGNALNEFLLKKAGKTWDDVVEESAALSDIDEASVRRFLVVAQESGRLPDVSGLSIIEILEKLRLMDKGKLKRGAIILFGKDPNRFYPNIVVKIGRFGSDDADLKYQETEEGNLIELLQNVPEQLNHKFLTKQIDFQGLLRIEKGEYPVAALREMLLNALVHRSYMGAMIQMRVYDNKLSIWNEGALPEGMDARALKGHHVSRPRNQLIADVCFKAGYIDAWGRGTLKIINSCKDAGLPEPDMVEFNGGLLVTVFKNKYSVEQLKKSGLNERQVKAVQYVLKKGKITNKEYQKINNVSKATATRDLSQLYETHKILIKTGSTGAGTEYTF